MISDNPKISVIVPNYNNASYLKQCLESILEQTWKNLEIVVVDDASTDDSVAVIRKFSDRYKHIIRCIYNETNQGVAKSRHIAIQAASAGYITTLDADDYYADPKKLEAEINHVVHHKKKHHEDIIAFSNIILEKDDGRQIVLGNETNIAQGDLLMDILGRTCMIPRDFVFAKSLYLSVGGYDTSLSIYEDWDLKIRLARSCRYIYSGIHGVVYRRHGNGLSNSPVALHIEMLQKIFSKNINLLNGDDQVFAEQNFSKHIETLTKAFRQNTDHHGRSSR